MNDIDWIDPAVVVQQIAAVFSDEDVDEEYDVFDNIQHIEWIIGKHFEAKNNSQAVTKCYYGSTQITL